MKPALSQVCTLASSFEQDVADFAAGQCGAMEVWLTKLERFLESQSLAELHDLLREHGMATPVGSFQGGLLVSQGAARAEAWSLFERRLELCQASGIGTLVLAADVAGPLTQQDVDRVRLSLAQAAEQGGRHQVRLALEFQNRAALANNLQTAVALVAEVSSPHLGICLDTFHYYTGPSKPEDLHGLTRANLFHVQVCDLIDVPREFAADADRILPGEGDIPLQPIIAYLREIAYEGYVSVELMNPTIRQVSPRQFGEIASTALRRLLGQASMA